MVDENSTKSCSEESADHIESIITRDISANLRSEEEPSARMPSGAVQLSKRDFSSGSQSSIESFETALDPRSSDINDRVSEAILNNDQSVPGDSKSDDTAALSSPVSKQDQQHRQVSDVTHESMLVPPLQVMNHSGRYVPGRISSSVFATSSTPRDRWSVASNESLFSLHVGHINFNNGAFVMGAPSGKSSNFAISGELTSNRPSMIAGHERTKSAADKGSGHAGSSMTHNSTHDLIVQKFHDHIDPQAHIPEMSPQNKGKIQPLPPPFTIKNPEKPSSCCKKLSCCCSCNSLSCCCSSSGFCCSRLRCQCSKMPSCSCSNYTLGWCCDWNCYSKRTCCSFSCCPEGSCSPSCSNCSKAICCWKWSCWELFSCWNWNCCCKGSCCRSWSCCSTGACCRSWSCFSNGSCCASWTCCSVEKCCEIRNCFGSCNCCSKGTCCENWKCCAKRSCCGSRWNCCSKGSCCKSFSCCCQWGSSCNSWSNCMSGSCCPTSNCCSSGTCSMKCGSCYQGWIC